MTRKEFVQEIISGYLGNLMGAGVPYEVGSFHWDQESQAEWIQRVLDWSRTPEGEASRVMAAANQTRAEMARRAGRLSEAGVPPYLIQKLAEPILDTGPFGAAKEHGQKLILVLAGGVGCGKTIAAIWLIGEAATNHDSVLYLSSAALARWDRYSQEEMGKLFAPRLLVIDDVGSEFRDEKGAFVSLLEDVINTRCLNGRRTVITTNMSADKFKVRYEDRIASRVSEFGAFFEFDGADMRRETTAG